MDEIRERVTLIQEKIKAFPGARVMAVVKTRTPEQINFLMRECGITLLGENRVQELLSHYEALDAGAEIHFIGTLQKNKVKYIIDKVAMIESLDSIALAEEIEKRAASKGIVMPVLFEVNIGKEPAKSGVMPEELEALCQKVATLPHLDARGIMTIAPAVDDTEIRRAYFAQTRTLLHEVYCRYFPSTKTPILSMGMSGSYTEALAEGATEIRLGTAIFGKRNIT